ncbi:hypothetical protein CHS0354_018645 [Potamilus streckersoni]|uniref:Uncharacterized protein n=1 Tax=Potamilus streckersoni TaxID=2493646 RepID=A0AAE0SLE4_9BIVA|nr:hypothetical protein CHS0354_018645 [Potamilus streckersoni]
MSIRLVHTPSLSVCPHKYRWKRSLTDIEMQRRHPDLAEVRLKTIPKLPKIDTTPSVGFEIQNFKIFGELRRTQTQVNNPLPTQETIDNEKMCLTFDIVRRQQPHLVVYNRFYKAHIPSKTLTSSLSTSK